MPAPGILLVACLVAGSVHYRVPVDVLVAIRTVEGGRAGQESQNANGSRDLGAWQINDGALSALAQAWGLPVGEARRLVRDDECVNALTAAYTLRTKIDQCGNLDCGIAWYNSSNPKFGVPYREKVRAAMAQQRRVGGGP
jgi:hypothetical protein